MKEVIISEFKAKCIAILKGVQVSREPVVITRRGKAIARIEPMPEETRTRALGVLREMTIKGDIVSEESVAEWEMEHESAS